MTLAEAAAPPMGEMQKPQGSLIDLVRAERAVSCRNRFVKQFLMETEFEDEPAKYEKYLRGLRQFDANLGMGFERFNLQPLIDQGIVKLEDHEHPGTANANVTLNEGFTADDVGSAYDADPKTNRYKAAVGEVREAFRNTDTLSSYSSETFRMFDEQGQPVDRDFLLAFTSVSPRTYEMNLREKPEKPLELSDKIDKITAEQVDEFEKNVAELPNVRDIKRAAPVDGAGVYTDSEGKTTKILIECPIPGKYVGLKAVGVKTGNLQTQQWQIGYEFDPAKGNEERANGSDYTADPFIESACAQELLNSFDAVGLGLSDHTREVFAESNNGKDSEKRYGQAYAELTREISKIIDQPETRSVADLFSGTKEDVLAAVANINPEEISSYSAALVVDLLKQLAAREQIGEHEFNSDLPVTKKSISIKTGACKDAEQYFTSDTTHSVNIGGKAFLTKTEGQPTFMNVDPIMFNGITVQPGALFNRQPDGSFGMLRLTMYAVGDEAADTFGVQYKEAIGGHDHMTAIKYGKVENYIQHR